ncbi:hypothetical protein [Sulfolobus spindle-shaped virus]|nr:hypothetical protein [Sulfolobus spindle-shaped virus]AZG03323.1 hypothetical protein [Sulfolobus spindle-shaped virus]QGH71246.1 hypothetical protein [Sulfolobus super-elliptical virus]
MSNNHFYMKFTVGLVFGFILFSFIYKNSSTREFFEFVLVLILFYVSNLLDEIKELKKEDNSKDK